MLKDSSVKEGSQVAGRKISFSKVLCDGNELAYVNEVLKSGWLTTASKAFEFETRFAEAVGAPYACAVNSCTAALHLALESLGIGPGDQVLVPTMTFTATAEVVRYLGADPVFIDVEYGTCLLTPEIVAEALQQHPRAKVLMVVHYGGQAARMGRAPSLNVEHRTLNIEHPTLNAQEAGILDICREHGVRVVEDAAHAFPARLEGRMVGNLGDITCFSFYANKTITTGEGGMLVTHDEQVYQRAKVMRLHGIDRDIWKRFTSDKASWEYDVIAPGYKYNMPDVNAAIGLAQLERAEDLRRERQRCAEYYLANMRDLPGVDLPVIGVPCADHAWHLFPIVLNKQSPVERNRFIARLAEQGIATSVHYKPIHRMTYYRERYGLRAEDFPNAERIWQGCVSLPIYPSLTDEELEYIVHTVQQLVEG